MKRILSLVALGLATHLVACSPEKSPVYPRPLPPVDSDRDSAVSSPDDDGDDSEGGTYDQPPVSGGNAGGNPTSPPTGTDPTTPPPTDGGGPIDEPVEPDSIEKIFAAAAFDEQLEKLLAAPALSTTVPQRNAQLEREYLALRLAVETAKTDSRENAVKNLRKFCTQNPAHCFALTVSRACEAADVESLLAALSKKQGFPGTNSFQWVASLDKRESLVGLPVFVLNLRGPCEVKLAYGLNKASRRVIASPIAHSKENHATIEALYRTSKDEPARIVSYQSELDKQEAIFKKTDAEFKGNALCKNYPRYTFAPCPRLFAERENASNEIRRLKDLLDLLITNYSF